MRFAMDSHAFLFWPTSWGKYRNIYPTDEDLEMIEQGPSNDNYSTPLSNIENAS